MRNRERQSPSSLFSPHNAQRGMRNTLPCFVRAENMPIYCKLQILQIERWFFFVFLCFLLHICWLHLPLTRPSQTHHTIYSSTPLQRSICVFHLRPTISVILLFFLIWFLIVFHMYINSFLRLSVGFFLLFSIASVHAVTAGLICTFVPCLNIRLEQKGARKRTCTLFSSMRQMKVANDWMATEFLQCTANGSTETMEWGDDKRRWQKLCDKN